MNITAAAIRANRVTWVAIIIVILGGIGAYLSLPRAEDPGFPIRTALVMTQFPGASPERVELLVSDKIEKKIQEMPELDSVQSTSKTGVSFVFVNVRSEFKAKQLRPIWDSMRRKVDSARGDLPDGVIGPFVNDEFGDVFGTIVAITGDGYSYAELKEVAEEVRDELLALPDTAKVEIWGAQEERVFLEYRNERLAELGLTPAQLQQILQQQNIVTSGGQIKVATERYSLEPTGNFESVRDIEETLIQLPRGGVIPLGDLVEVKRGYVDPPSSKFHKNGQTALALAISMREGGNITNLGEQVKTKLPQLEAQYPIGIEMDIVVFQPNDVNRLVDDFVGNLLQAVVIVMLAMILFLGLRTGLVVASLIPTAIAAALLVMSFFDIGIDQMSLASLIIALGLLVDNAVVMAESTLVSMEQGKKPFDAAVGSAKELRIPLLTSSLTTCAAFLPIFLAKSETGEYTAPLFKVVTITLLCSWLLSITLTPLLCVAFLRVKKKKKEGKGEAGKGEANKSSEEPAQDPEGSFNTRFYQVYRKMLLLGLKNRALVLASVVLMFFGAGQLAGKVPQLFFPPSDNPSFIVELEQSRGTAIEHTEEEMRKLEQFILRELMSKDGSSGVTHFSTYVGDGGPRFYLSYNQEQANPAYGAIIAQATDRSFVDGALPKLRSWTRENLPDSRVTVEPRALGPSSKAPLMFEVIGSDTDELFRIVNQLKAKLKEQAGTTNIRDDWGARTKKLEVRIDQNRARRAGITSQDIAVSLQTGFSGFKITDYREGDDLIPVVMRSVAADRQDLGKVENLSIQAQSSGARVPLKQVADVHLAWEASQIRRKNRKKAVTVLANLEGDRTAAEVNAAIVPWLDEQQQSWPVGYDWDIAGTAKNSAKANKSIGDQLPIAGLIIVMLLVWQFNSIRRPLIILMTVPLGVIGVILGLFSMGSYFGFMTLLGIISLSGIVINNAIVLIDRIKIEIEENGLPPNRAIVESAQRRLRPILLTTFTTILGLVPLWFGGGPMWEPMAIGIIFGLAFSTLLTLGVVPVLYSLLFRVSFKGFDYDKP